MATVSSASGGNGARGELPAVRYKGMSGSDWTRLQRLRQARTYDSVNLKTNKDIAAPLFGQFKPNLSSSRDTFPVVGTSKIRRTTGQYTDYIASQTADYVIKSQGRSQGLITTIHKLCNCTSSTLQTKTGICSSCNVATKVRMM